MGANIYRNKKPALVFLVPGFLFMAVYLYYPFFKNILNSFMEIKQLGSSGTGFNTPWYHNYREMLHDEYVWVFIKNTLLMMAATLAGQVGIAIVLALMVVNIGRGKQCFKTVFFSPIVISATALGLLFNLLFLYDKGMINQVLEALGRKELIDWKAEGIALPTMMLPVMWQYVGFYFVILVTGLNNISDELYEAAKIDGASTMQRIRYLSLPLLHNVICTCSVLAVTGALKVFDLPWTMFPKGMPLKSTFLTGTYMYYHTMETKNVDYGSALAVLIVVLGIVLSKVVNTIFREKDY